MITLRSWVVLVIVAVLAAPLLAGQRSGASSLTPEQQAQQLQAVLAQKVDDLGVCNIERGQLQQLSAKVLNGQLVTATSAGDQIRSAVEAANPGKTLDSTWKIIDKPAHQAKGDSAQ